MIAETTSIAASDEQVEHYAQLVDQLRRADEPAWLTQVRDEAIAQLRTLGFPTSRDEDWRFTNPAPLTRTAFVPITPPGGAGVSEDALRPPENASRLNAFGTSGGIPDLDCHTAVFVDGCYAPALSTLDDLLSGAGAGVGAGVRITRLSEAVQTERALLEPYLASDGEASSRAFTLLNAALWQEGLLIQVADDCKVDKPIHVLNVTTSGRSGRDDQPTMTQPRLVILAGDRSHVTIIEHYIALDEQGTYFTNAVTQLAAGRGAHVSHYFIEEESPAAYQVSTLLTHQASDSDVHSHTVLFGGKLVRNNVNPRLDGPGAHCLVNGLYLGTDQQHLDNQMRVEHNAPNCDSRQFYKGVLRDSAHAVFSGRIFVAKGAQKTDAKQTNANLLLSDTAEATSKPQLEIYADDVKCTHGATVGQIDEQAVFYLMARGVEREAARGLVIFAFAGESLQRMELEPMRNWLGRKLAERLPQGELLAGIV